VAKGIFFFLLFLFVCFVLVFVSFFYFFFLLVSFFLFRRHYKWWLAIVHAPLSSLVFGVRDACYLHARVASVTETTPV
jgi:hypothetical protein